MLKRIILGVAAAFFSCAVWANPVLDPSLQSTDLRQYGNASAGTTLYLFSSLSCPHCSVFHEEITPVLLSEFVEKDKARLVLVDMPFDPRSMTGAMLSRCLPVDQYEKFMDTMFQNQTMWMNAHNPRDLITGYAKLLGMTDQKINQCLADQKLNKAITSQRDNLARLYNVRGMPSLVLVQSGKNPVLMVGSDKKVILDKLKTELGDK